MIFQSFFKALAQLSDPRFRRVLWLGIGLTLALLIGSYAGLLWLIEWLTGESTELPLVGEVTWVGDLLSFGSFFLMIVLSIFLMVPVASAITSMFLDEVAQAVEDRHYPHLPQADKVPFSDALRDTLNFLGVLIAANLLAIVLYVMFPPAALFIFWGLNGFLLGREYFTLAAIRRIGRTGAKDLRAKHRGAIWMAGILMAMPLSVPLVNLLIPILGAATFTHIFHALNARR
ncbi:EI24 domain-containing protein [Primorskyibacter aestuariivivens]|uniref:EI24 domain-containing protein n=1 Tax=Primorskyibacter aestuariivivens TaxID=1888912 RepID=UPI0023004709|nr:EI24 domain-containing protein [Primorskyibacter aestuariivivens]MDA7429502.1 EI24 domain-containing protein [Primorskyibacter aestuariivivens]